MDIAREVKSLLGNADADAEDVIEIRRAVAQAVRPLRASRARSIVAEAIRALDDETRSLALPLVERLPLRCRPSPTMLLGLAAEIETAPVLSARAQDNQAVVGRQSTMVKDTALVTLTDAHRAIGFSRQRLNRVLKRMGIKPIYVGRIGYVPGSIVNMLARTHRAWRSSEGAQRWQKKTGHQFAEAS